MAKRQLYAIVKDDLQQKIKSNVYATGDKLPTENELCNIYGVGKATVRQALEMLSNYGYIYSVRRVGYFVSEPKNDEYILKFDEMTAGEEALTDISVLFANLADLSTIDASPYRLPSSSKALKVGRLFSYLDTPVCYEEKFLLYTREFRIKDADLFAGNSSELINEYISTYTIKKELTVAATRAEKMSENYLKINPKSPVMLVKQVYLDRYERPFAFCYNYYRHDHVTLKALTYKRDI